MARLGRPPKPTALKILNGSAEHHPERRNRDEPIPQGPPSCRPISPRPSRRPGSTSWPPCRRGSSRRPIATSSVCTARRWSWSARSARWCDGTGLLCARGHAQRDELAKNPLLAVLRDHVNLVRGLAADLGSPRARAAASTPCPSPATIAWRPSSSRDNAAGEPGRPAARTRADAGSGRQPDPVRAYARAVVSGRSVAGPLVRLACRRHLDDLRSGKERGLRWNLPEAQRVIELIGQMRLPTGEPFLLQPAQAFIVGSLFGWLLADGGPRFRTAYVEMGKGNGKTPWRPPSAWWASWPTGSPRPRSTRPG